MTQIPYIREKITEARMQLTNAVKIKDGLRNAGFLLIAANINTDGLDERIRHELASLVRELTKRGNLDDTLHRMRMKTAKALASRIDNLEVMVDDI